MPTVVIYDNFAHGNFAVPGGGPYSAVSGAAPTADATVVPSGEPASAKWTAAGNLEYQLGSPPSRGWVGFYFRINTGEEPAADALMFQLWTNGFGQALKAYWNIAANYLQFTVADVTYQATPALIDGWHWLECIYDVSGATHTGYVRVDGSDITSFSDAGGGSGTTVQYAQIGPFFANCTVRIAHMLVGSAASTSDWLGQPASGQVILPDADIATTGWSTAPLFSKINDNSDATVITATAS